MTRAAWYLPACTSRSSTATERARRSKCSSRGSSVRFTALGTGTVALSPTRSCAGHLLEADELRLLIDCGSGVTRRLAELGKPWQTITHVALTHFHVDHHGDLPTLLFGLRYGMSPARAAPLEIIGPTGTASLIERLAAAYGSWVLETTFPLSVREIT